MIRRYIRLPGEVGNVSTAVPVADQLLISYQIRKIELQHTLLENDRLYEARISGLNFVLCDMPPMPLSSTSRVAV